MNHLEGSSLIMSGATRYRSGAALRHGRPMRHREFLAALKGAARPCDQSGTSG